jgi:hypothetical protein
VLFVNNEKGHGEVRTYVERAAPCAAAADRTADKGRVACLSGEDGRSGGKEGLVGDELGSACIGRDADAFEYRGERDKGLRFGEAAVTGT